MLVPSIILIVLTNAYPLLYAVKAAFYGGSLIGPSAFVGLQNFRQPLHDPAFWQAVQFTGLYVLVAVLGSWAFGLGIALILRMNFPGRAAFRALLLLPWVVPIVVSVTSWSFLVGTLISPADQLANLLGLGHPLFLADPALAVATVCAYKIWISYPFMMVAMGSALETVDPSVYEAARIDGAGRFAIFRRVTLPLIARPTYISWIVLGIFTVNDFPSVFLLTGGGPGNSTQTLVIYAYNLVFEEFQPGPGIVVAFAITAIMIAVSAVLFRLIRRSFSAA